jgi:hypothetical protein
MTRIATLGAESGDASEFNSSSLSLVSPGKTGNFAYYLNGVSNDSATLNFSNQYDLYISLWIYPVNDNALHNLLEFRNGSTVLFALRSSTSFELLFYQGATNLHSFGLLPLNQWTHVMVHILVDTTSGLCELKKNGTLIYSEERNTGSSAIDNLRFVTRSGLGPSRYYVDDIVLNNSSGVYNNTWPGMLRLLPTLVSGDGDISDMTRGGVDTGENWSQVSDTPVDTASWVEAAGEEGDLYTIEPVASLPEGTEIQGYTVVAIGSVDSGTGAIAGQIKSADVVSVDDPVALVTSWLAKSFTFPVDPDGNVPWLLSRINALQIGAKGEDIS